MRTFSRVTRWVGNELRGSSGVPGPSMLVILAVAVIGAPLLPAYGPLRLAPDAKPARDRPPYLVEDLSTKDGAGATCRYDARGRLDSVAVRAPEVRALPRLPIEGRTGARYTEQWVGWRPLLKPVGAGRHRAIRGDRDDVKAPQGRFRRYWPDTRSIHVRKEGRYRASAAIQWFDPRPAYRNVVRARATVSLRHHFDPASGRIQGGCAGPVSVIWAGMTVDRRAPKRVLPVRATSNGSGLAGDFDGDGRGDVYVDEREGADRLLWGDGRYLRPAARAPQMELERSALVGDYDGNGASDIFWYGAGADVSDEIWWGRSRRSFEAVDESVRGTYDPVVGDFDGDGRSDVLWYAGGDEDAERERIWWGTDEPRGFVSTGIAERQVVGEFDPVAGNFDGDCCDDVLWVPSSDDAPSAETVVWRGGSERRFDDAEDWDVLPAFPVRHAAVVGNFDGGCCDDVFFVAENPSDDDVQWWGARDGFVRAPGSAYIQARGMARLRPVVADFVESRRPADEILWLRTL
jgi:hypothetical protein